MQWTRSRTAPTTAYSPNEILDKAWNRITKFHEVEIEILKSIELVNQIERLIGFELISNDYKQFLIEFALRYSDIKLTKITFKELFNKLFELKFEDLFTEQEQENNDYDNVDQTTQTIRSEYLKFEKQDSLMDLTTKKMKLKQEISLLKDILIKQHRNIQPFNELIINKKLVDRYTKLIEIYQLTSANGDEKSRGSGINIHERLKSSINKQDFIIKKINRKFELNSRKTKTAKSLRIISIFVFLFMVISYFLSLLADLPEKSDSNYDKLSPIGYRNLPNYWYDGFNPIDRWFYYLYEYLFGI